MCESVGVECVQSLMKNHRKILKKGGRKLIQGGILMAMLQVQDLGRIYQLLLVFVTIICI